MKIGNFSRLHLKRQVLNLNGNSLLRADYPNDVKSGRICIYYYETLTLNMLPMNVFFAKLQSDKQSVLWKLLTDLLVKILMNLSLPSNFNPYLTLLLGDHKTKNS